MVKVFLSPTIALHSPAMVRIANALTNYAPPHYKIISKREEADLCVFYPVSYEWIHYLQQCLDRGQDYAMIQCCFKSGREEEDKLVFDLWKPWWQRSLVVWSYLDLLEGKGKEDEIDSIPFYWAPLGIDEAFLLPAVVHPKRDYIVTTGTVHGKGAEAILECWEAAKKCELDVVHVGPFPVGIDSRSPYQVEILSNLDQIADRRVLRHHNSLLLVTGCTDQTLRGIYQNAKYVCSLRYVEGFELPALEALSCGTRSIVFTQPATTKWFFDYCEFVPECSGSELVDHLVRKFSSPYESIPRYTVEQVRSKFSWGILCWRFWSIVEKELSMRRQVKETV